MVGLIACYQHWPVQNRSALASPGWIGIGQPGIDRHWPFCIGQASTDRGQYYKISIYDIGQYSCSTGVLSLSNFWNVIFRIFSSKDDFFVKLQFIAKQKIFYVEKVENMNTVNEYGITFMFCSVKVSRNFDFLFCQVSHQ